MWVEVLQSEKKAHYPRLGILKWIFIISQLLQTFNGKNEARNQDNREIILGKVPLFVVIVWQNSVKRHSIKPVGHKAELRSQKAHWTSIGNSKERGSMFAYIQRATKQHAAFENSAAKCMFKLECCQQFYLWELRWLSISLSEKKSIQENDWLLNFTICGDGNMLRLFISVQLPTGRSSSVFHTYLANSR